MVFSGYILLAVGKPKSPEQMHVRKSMIFFTHPDDRTRTIHKIHITWPIGADMPLYCKKETWKIGKDQGLLNIVLSFIRTPMSR